jgi:hypothetical protein
MSMDEYALYDRDEPGVSGFERELYDAVSEAEPWALVEEFSELERVSGSEDERRAADYIAGRLDAFGVSYERHEPELYLSIPGEASLVAGGESFDAVKTVSFGGGEAAGELYAVGGDEAEGHGGLLAADLSGVEQADVAGRVVVLTSILPIGAILDLQEMGAAGVVVRHPHEREPHEGIATPVWGGAPEPGEEDRVPRIPVLTVSAPVGDRLYELAAEGATAACTAETTEGWFECPVVVAEIEAGEPQREGDFVLLHGHYDSWHYGVADNATGDAALLELARVFQEGRHELKRDLRVAWWPGHSTGRYAGSTWYAEAFGVDVEEHCLAQVNCDSPGAVDATEFEDMAVWMPEADALCRGAIADVAGKEGVEDRPPRAGDYSFDNLGVTGLFMLSSNIPREVREARGYHAVGGCGGHSDAWHLSTDTLDKADPEVLVRDVRVYATAVARLLAAPVPPLEYARTVDRHREVVADYDERAGDAFDLSPVREALDDLAAAVAAFDERVTGGDVDPAAATDAYRRLSRHLVRVNFASEGAFEQDPATDRPPYPGLEPATRLAGMDADERRRHEVRLRRQRNRAVHELRRALEVVA